MLLVNLISLVNVRCARKPLLPSQQTHIQNQRTGTKRWEAYVSEKTLFKNFKPKKSKSIKETCRSCNHRERWQCGGSIIQYCGKLSSNRTFNKKLKIKVTNPACEFWVSKEIINENIMY